MTIKQREIYTSKYYRHGKSFGFIIPPDIREIMHLVPGDQIAMNYQEGVLWCVRVTTEMIISRDKMAKIFDRLFPDREARQRRAEVAAP
jgi:antitoxin component of MazEF toxin-antitoxin module